MYNKSNIKLIANIEVDAVVTENGENGSETVGLPW